MGYFVVKKNRNLSGFTLVELMVASVMFLGLGAGIYKIIQSQTQNQTTELAHANKESISQSILNRFRTDVSKIDPNWQRLGIASVYPHPGFRFGENHYVSSPLFDVESLSDAVTFLRKHDTKTDIYNVSNNLRFPSGATDSGYEDLFGSWINISGDQNINPLEINDWVVVYAAGKYMLGIVAEIKAGALEGDWVVQLGFPSSDFFMAKSELYAEAGFITQKGVIPTNIDYTGTKSFVAGEEMGKGFDDFLEFRGQETYLQVVDPVSYELDWLTDDGLPKTTNAYVLGADGEPESMVVRTTYGNNVVSREYLGKADSLGFTYDVLRAKKTNGVDGVQGHMDGEVIRGVGREQDTVVDGFVQFDENYIGLAYMNMVHAASNIVGVRMLISQKWKQSGEPQELTAEAKVALDSVFADGRYQQNEHVDADLSDDLHRISELAPQEQMGKPIYYKSYADDAAFIVTPVMDLSRSGEKGKLVFTHRNGCPAKESCALAESITERATQFDFVVEFGDDQHQFFPSQVQEVTDANGHKSLVVGGLGLKDGQRVPMMARVNLGDRTMSEVLAPSVNGSGLCSIANCELHILDQQSLGQKIRDTAGGFFQQGNELYVSSLTKAASNEKYVRLFKTELKSDGIYADFSEVVLDVGETGQGRVITAVSNAPIHYKGEQYLPICLSRSIPCMDGMQYEDNTVAPPAEPSQVPPAEDDQASVIEASLIKVLNFFNPIGECLAQGATPCDFKDQSDGKIMLYPLSGTGTPVEVAQHNYLCSSLQTVGTNLLVSGKLVTQPLKGDYILDVIDGHKGPKKMYTDELASIGFNDPDNIEDGALYADGYLTLKSGFEEDFEVEMDMMNQEENYGSSITWNTGTSITQFPDGSLGFALGNKNNDPNGTSDPVQNVITVDMSPGGMRDRVTSSINTALDNLSASIVTSSYHGASQEFKGEVIIPGVMLVDFIDPAEGQGYEGRTARMPIPRLLPPAEMDQGAWIDFFFDYHDPKDQVTGKDYAAKQIDFQDHVGCTVSIPSGCSVF